MSDNKSQPQAKPEPQETLTMKQLVEQVIPAAIAAAAKAGRDSAPQPQVQVPRHAAAAPRCIVCGQEKTACNDKHVEMVVFPQRYPHHATYFTGVTINGVRYLSNDASHKIVVPESAASGIESLVHTFENNEQDMAVGRVAKRNSGVVSPNGTSVSPATQAWR